MSMYLSYICTNCLIIDWKPDGIVCWRYGSKYDKYFRNIHRNIPEKKRIRIFTLAHIHVAIRHQFSYYIKDSSCINIICNRFIFCYYIIYLIQISLESLLRVQIIETSERLTTQCFVYGMLSNMKLLIEFYFGISPLSETIDGSFLA